MLVTVRIDMLTEQTTVGLSAGNFFSSGALRKSVSVLGAEGVSGCGCASVRSR